MHTKDSGSRHVWVLILDEPIPSLFPGLGPDDVHRHDVPEVHEFPDKIRFLDLPGDTRDVYSVIPMFRRLLPVVCHR